MSRYQGWIVFLLALPCFSSVSCSYHYGNLNRSLPGGYDRVAVPTFANATVEPGIEPYFTSAMIEEIERAHVVNVASKSSSQVLLEGTITGLRFEGGAEVKRTDDGGPFSNLPPDATFAKEYRVVVTVALTLKRISDGTILWSGDFNGEQRYAAPQISSEILNSANPLYNQSARHMTLKTLARAMMAEAHERMTENF